MMPAISKKQGDFLREVYFPTTYYKEVLAQTLKEVEGEMEQQRALDDLVLKAEANVYRLAETYRLRAMTPGQDEAFRDAQRTLSDYGKELRRQAAGQRAFVDDPGKDQIEALRKLSVNAAPKAVAREAVKLAEQRAARIMDGKGADATKSAVARKAFLDILNSAGVNVVNLASNELNQSILRTFGDDATLAKVKEQASKDGRALAAAARLAAPEDIPRDVDKAARTVSAVESPYAHGRVASGLTPDEDEMVRLFLSRLRDEDSPGRATPDEFESPEQYAQAKAAYEKARDSGAYLEGDAEWFAVDYLQATATAHELRARQKAGPGYEDPYKEAQRRAFERGGYTAEEVALMKYRGTPMEKYVRPAYARAREDIEPQNEIEEVIQALYDQSEGKVSLSQIQAMLDQKRHQEMTSARQNTRGDRKNRRSEKKEVRSTYSPEAMEQAEIYLIALRLQASGVGAEGDDPNRPVAPAVPQPPAPDAAAAEEVRAEEIKQEVKEDFGGPKAQEGQTGPAAPEPISDDMDMTGDLEAEAVDASGDETEAHYRRIVLDDVGEVGYEFVDESDRSKARYRRTERGYVPIDAKGNQVGDEILGSTTAGAALALAEQGQYKELTEFQNRLAAERARRRREKALAVEAGKPPPGAPATLGLAGVVTGGPYAPMTPDEIARMRARLAAEAPAAPAGPVRKRYDSATNTFIEVP